MRDEAEPECTDALEALIGDIRSEVRAGDDPAAVAGRVAGRLEPLLADARLLLASQREPGDDGYRQHVLHVEPDGSFSVVALVWRPGQSTPVHDHVSWCVPGVHAGREEEIRYRIADGPGGERWLEETGRQINHAGTVTSLVPPGDLHRVSNPGPDVAVSIHVYGADIGELGSSIRRTYDLEVRRAEPARGSA